MVSLQKQRQELLQQKKFQLAIELTQISEEPNDVQAETIRQIHKRYAKELFDERNFAAAMQEFESAAANPYDVIRLFPDLLQENKRQSTTVAVETAATVLTLGDKDLENALTALIDFLLNARRNELAKLRSDKNIPKSLLSIIDTTLLKCYLQTNDSLIAPLLRLNYCHLDESEKCLKKYDKITELIILYQVNGKHKRALELLQAQANSEGSNLYGYERTIRYLQELGASHLQLIFEFADWVLRKHPDDGLRIFTDDFIEVEHLPRAKVLDFLLTKHKPLVIPYLEHVINIWADTNTLIHNVLIKQYLGKIIIKQLQETVSETVSAQQMLLEYRKKLHDMLQNSTHYSPDLILQEFPINDLLEERALLLGRLKKHDEVLAIYILIMGDINKAIDYCNEHYDNDKEIFVTLLMTILQPNIAKLAGVERHPDFIKPNNELVIDLLNRFAAKISPDKIVQHLPNDITFERLHKYLETVMRSRIAESHQSYILLGLLNAEISRVKQEIETEQSKSFEINESSVCSECKRRFANQKPFVRYPNGQILHLSCHDKISERKKN